MLARKLRASSERSNVEKEEIIHVNKSQGAEIEKLRKRLNDADYNMREAKYEITQLTHKLEKTAMDHDVAEARHKETIDELKAQLDMANNTNTERYKAINVECQNAVNLIEAIHKSIMQDSRESSIPKTTKHLLEKALKNLSNLKRVASANTKEDPESYSSSPNRQLLTSSVSSVSVRNAAASMDSTLLEVCRNLEDENISLAASVESLKSSLNDALRDCQASKLIPHYRLAIVRSRSYAANLLEQNQREQAINQALREQLEATYVDLKKVVAEKRKLYSQLSKASLLKEEQEVYPDQRVVAEEVRRQQQAQRYSDNTHQHSSSGSSRDHPPAFYEKDVIDELNPPDRHNDVRNIPTGSSFSAFPERPAARVRMNVPPAQQQQQQHGSPATRSAATSGGDTYMTAVPREPSFVRTVHESNNKPVESDQSSKPASFGINDPVVQSHPYQDFQPTEQHIQLELGTLDREIEQLKQRLSQEAAWQSQKILSDVIEQSLSNTKKSLHA